MEQKTTLEKFMEMESDCPDLVTKTPIERLRFFISLMCDKRQSSQDWFDIEFLFDECTNNCRLLVSSLRQMSEAPMETPILAVRHGFVRFELITWPCCGEFIGWIPVPVYKPC